MRSYDHPVVGSFRLLYRSTKVLIENWQVFGGIMLIYLVLELLLVQGLSLLSSGGSLQQTKSILDGASNLLNTTGSLFLLLIGNGTGNSSSTAYQFILLITISLVLIWALRQCYLGEKIRIRDTFYRGVAPLVTFFLVLLTIGVEFIPGTIGVILYSAVATNGIASTLVEKELWGVISIVLALVTIYFASGTLFALYIVTLENMTPVRAIKMANQLVKGRRVSIMARVVFLPIAAFVILAILLTPFLLFAVKAAPVAFFVVTAFMVAILHSYLYGLYRELLNE